MSFRKTPDFSVNNSLDTGSATTMVGAIPTITRGRNTLAIAINHTNDETWTLRSNGDNVSTSGDVVHDTNAGRVVIQLEATSQAIGGGSFMYDIAYTTTSGGVYVSGLTPNGIGGYIPRVWVINPVTNAIINVLSGFGVAGDAPAGMCYDSSHPSVYVGVNTATGCKFLVLDTTTHTQVAFLDPNESTLIITHLVFGINKIWGLCLQNGNTVILRIDSATRSFDLAPVTILAGSAPGGLFFSGQSGLFASINRNDGTTVLYKIDQTNGSTIWTQDLTPSGTASQAGPMAEIDAVVCSCGSPTVVPNLWVWVLDSVSEHAHLQLVIQPDLVEPGLGTNVNGNVIVPLPDTNQPANLVTNSSFGCCCCVNPCCNQTIVGTILVPQPGRDQVLVLTVNDNGLVNNTPRDYASILTTTALVYQPVTEFTILAGVQTTSNTAFTKIAARSFDFYNFPLEGTYSRRIRFIATFGSLNGLHVANLQLRNMSDNRVVAIFHNPTPTVEEFSTFISFDEGLTTLLSGKIFALEISINAGGGDSCVCYGARLVVDHV